MTHFQLIHFHFSRLLGFPFAVFSTGSCLERLFPSWWHRFLGEQAQTSGPASRSVHSDVSRCRHTL